MPDPDGLAGLDFTNVTPAEFAALVKPLSRKEIAEALRGELRTRVLAEIFGRMGRHFRPEAAGSLTALIRWEISGSNGEPTVVWETDIAEGACAVRPGATDAKPRTTLALSDGDFVRLASGNASPVAMFMTRKIKVAGDVALASGLARLFDIPKA